MGGLFRNIVSAIELKDVSKDNAKLDFGFSYRIGGSILEMIFLALL
jgi:hypothetical protein